MFLLAKGSCPKGLEFEDDTTEYLNRFLAFQLYIINYSVVLGAKNCDNAFE